MYHIIINKAAASGQCEKSWLKLAPYLESRQIAYEAHLTDSPEETGALIRRLTSQGTDTHLILLGGDGTLNLAIQHIVSFARTRLSIIPIGSGNDFARDFGIKGQPERIFHHLLTRPTEKLLDYGLVTYKEKNSQDLQSRKFLISCGTGFDAAICENVNTGRLKARLNQLHLGQVSYLMTGVSQLFAKNTCEVTLHLDNKEEIRIPFFLAVAMIHRYEGGGIAFAPDADPADGLFHLLAVEDMKPLRRVYALLCVLARRHMALPFVHYKTCQTLRCQFSSPVWFHTDGEVPGEITECTLVCRSGLRFVY